MMQCNNVGSSFDEDSMCTMYGTKYIILYAVDGKYTVKYTQIRCREPDATTERMTLNKNKLKR